MDCVIGTIDFYHFIPFSVILTLAWVTGSVQWKTYGLHFLTCFSTDQDKTWHGVDTVQLELPDTILE